MCLREITTRVSVIIISNATVPISIMHRRFIQHVQKLLVPDDECELLLHNSYLFSCLPGALMRATVVSLQKSCINKKPTAFKQVCCLPSSGSSTFLNLRGAVPLSIRTPPSSSVNVTKELVFSLSSFRMWRSSRD